MDNIVGSILGSVIAGRRAEVEAKVKEALDERIPAAEILNQGLIAAMSEVGKQFEIGRIYVPEMLIAARAMQTGLAILKPHLVENGIKATGRVVVGTVKGDLHDIGKNLVAMMLEGAGFEVIDLGTNVSPEKFVAAVQDHRPNIICMSALLTTTMKNMNLTVKALQESGVRENVKVLVGGAPVTQTFAEEIGADGYAPDASRAVS